MGLLLLWLGMGIGLILGFLLFSRAQPVQAAESSQQEHVE